jgi:drug/metabolite transporter (DMT)-like permease
MRLCTGAVGAESPPAHRSEEPAMSTPVQCPTLLPEPAAIATPRAWVTPLELALLGAIWGASFLFMRIAAPVFGAVPLVEVRLALGALVLLPFLWLGRAAFPLRLWPRLVLIGAINSALPFILFAWAAQRAPAGVGAIANAMVVLFTALVGFLFFGETIGRRRATALLIGFSGVVVLASGKVAGMSIGWAVVAGAAAALLYGIGINLVRRHLTGLPPAAVAAATLGMSALLVSPFALATWPSHAIPVSAWLSAAALGVVCTGAAFVMYYRLIARIGASRASTVTYLVPVFAVAWAWMVLGEPLTLTMGLAGLLILGSVAISQRAA